MTSEREHSKFIIQRFDTYIAGANTKGNFLLAMNTFLIGVIITNYSKIIELVSCKSAVVYINSGIVTLTILSLFAVFFSSARIYFLNKDFILMHVVFLLKLIFLRSNTYYYKINPFLFQKGFLLKICFSF